MSVSSALRRIQHGMPAILLGTLFNILDAVSTGLLIFPSGGNTFTGLDNKSLSMYIMSTLVSQIAMTLGGSLFPGALGAMLIEVLPFMRGVASDIRNALGDDSPSVVPTVVVAYALSSFLIGIVFMVLGALGFGSLMSYFPQTVLTGAIGGIGISMFILGLELPLPQDQSLTLSNAGTVLFNKTHVPVLLASLLPIAFLCISVRLEFLNRALRGAIQHPYYVPLYFLSIGIIFWLIVGIIGLKKVGGIDALINSGWLFSTGASLGGVGLKEALNYWTLFDFRLVKMSALSHAVTNFVLLVVIGVLNLPVYVPALALALDVPYSMNHELIGQGAANILAGACGSMPNILQLSYSVFFTRAGGGRVEAGVVIALTAVLFVVSSYLLLYIPTILASGLILFLGIELTLEAVWESAKDLIWTEWLVVMATLLACTFLGFAPGVGIGLAAAMVVYTGWGFRDLRARAAYVDRNLTILDQHSKRLGHRLHNGPSQRRSIDYSPLPATASEEGLGEPKLHPQVRIVRLSGYVFFGVIPSLEAQIVAQVVSPKKKGISEQDIAYNKQHRYIVLDMQAVNRVETAAAKLIRTKARDTPGITLALCGFDQGSGTAADLIRSGLDLAFYSDRGAQTFDSGKDCIKVFADCAESMTWCKADILRRERVATPKTGDTPPIAPEDHTEDHNSKTLADTVPHTEEKHSVSPVDTIIQLEPDSFFSQPPGETSATEPILVEDQASQHIVSSSGRRRVRYNRESLRAAILGGLDNTLQMVLRRSAFFTRLATPNSQQQQERSSSDN